MKKIKPLGEGDFSYLTKTFRIMKITAFLVLFAIIQTFANEAYSQQTTLSLDYTNTSLEVVLDKIEELSEFYFVVNENLVDLDRSVDLSVENKKIDEILDMLFSGTDVVYTITDRKIILAPSFLTENAQQQQSISGKVTDSGGQPLPGVTVVVKGTSQGTITNADGNYSLTNIPEDAILVFSFVGMQTQEIMVGTQTVINVTMEEETIALEEFVAIGYGTRRAGELTGSMSTLQSTAIQEMAVTNSAEVLRNVSGVTVQETGTPGEAPIIRIRGLGTINNNNPLWVVDGVPGASVNPNNIESISVLKDAASQAIYGSRAANGVVLVTTKSGRKNQKVQLNFRAKSGISRNVKQYDLLNTREYAEILWLEAQNAGISNYSHAQFGSGSEPVIPEYIIPAGVNEVDESLYDENTFPITRTNKEGTDWLNEITQNGIYQDYNIDISGGSNTTSYAFQIGYLGEEGILKYTGYDRYDLRSNISTDITDWLEIGEKFGITYSEDYGGQANNAESSSVSWSYRMLPFVPVYDIMGNFAGTKAQETGTWSNPAFLQYSNQHDQFNNLSINGNIYAEASIFNDVTITTLFGINSLTLDGRDLNFVEKARSIGITLDQLRETSEHHLQWNWSNTIEYSKVFNDKHNLTLLLGSEAIEFQQRWRSAGVDEFAFDNPHYMQLSSGIQNQSVGGNLVEWSLFSVFGRLNYVYANKYLIDAVVRRDGSSRFGSGGDYGIFPAFSLGWRISDENFMSSTKNWLNELKFRFGFGATGNDQIGNYNAYTVFTSDMTNSYYPMTGINVGAGTPGFDRSSLGNPDVKWETTQTTNFGFDATVLKNLDITFDLWQRITKDMLYPKRIPDVLGQATAPSINIGEMENKGFDIELGYNGSTSDLNYAINLNISHYKNKIIRLSDVSGESIQGMDYRGNIYTRAENGTSFPEFYGYVTDGIFQTQAEVDAHPSGPGFTNMPGYFKIRDVNEDGILSPNDRTYIGSPHPDLTSALNIILGYKDFQLSTRLYASLGNEIVNSVRRWIDFNHMAPSNRSSRRLYESWGSPYLNNNENAKMPIAIANDQQMQLPSTYFVEDGSYLRMQQLRLSYDLKDIFKTINLRSLQVYGEITNVFTLTNYSGLDPEISMPGIDMGVDLGAWPTPRGYMFGLNIGF